MPALLPAGCFHSHQTYHCCSSFFSFLLLIFNFLQIAIKPSSLSKMKTIFTQEIFTEQVHTLYTLVFYLQ